MTRRARKLFEPQPSGIVPPLGAAASSTDDLEILRFQRISAGATTAAQRFGEIRASLAEVPTELETAIELPSRLILSTAQDAVWLTSRALVRRTAPTPAQGSVEHRIGLVSRSRPRPLWSARLVTSEVLPQLAGGRLARLAADGARRRTRRAAAARAGPAAARAVGAVVHRAGRDRRLRGYAGADAGHPARPACWRGGWASAAAFPATTFASSALP